MRIALGIISLVLGLIIGAQSSFLYLGSAVFGDQPMTESSAGGLLVSLLYFVVGAFSFKLPRVAMVFAALAGLFGIVNGATSEFGDMTIWGVIALIIAALNWFAGRKPKPASQEPPSTTAP